MENKILDVLQITPELLAKTSSQYKFKSKDVIECLVNYGYRTWVFHDPNLTILITALEEHVHHLYKDRVVSIPGGEMTFLEFCSALRDGIVHKHLSYFVPKSKGGDLFAEYMRWLKGILMNVEKNVKKIHNAIWHLNSRLPIAHEALAYAQINLDIIDEFLTAIDDRGPEAMDAIIRKGKPYAWFSPPQAIIDENKKYFENWCAE